MWKRKIDGGVIVTARHYAVLLRFIFFFILFLTKGWKIDVLYNKWRVKYMTESSPRYSPIIIYIYIYTHLSVSDFPLNYKYDRISSSSSSIYSIYNTQLVRAVWPILAIVKYTVKSPCAFVIFRYVTFFFFYRYL